jgi:transposase
MTTLAPKDVLLADLDKVVRDTLAFFEGPGRATSARVDRWQARDVLMHFIYFHDATAWGIQSAALDGPPWPVPADSDVVNEVCRRLHEHESFDELLTQVRQAHARLARAARSAGDLDKPCFRRATGEIMTGRQRLELLARHWAEHVQALQEAAKGQARAHSA